MRRILVLAVGAAMGLTGCAGSTSSGGTRPAVRTTAGTPASPWRQVGESGWGGALNSVVATGPDEGWAGGYMDEGDEPVIMRLRDGVWRGIDVPGAHGVGPLDVVAASPGGEVWVFGRGRAAVDSLTSEIRAWRWDGRRLTLDWRQGDAVVDAAVTVGPRDVWVAGHPAERSGRCRGGFVKHRAGAGWLDVALPAGVCLYDMSALSARDIWAVGDVHGRPVSLHWDGRAWHAAPLPSQVSGQQGVLTGIAAASPTQVWAVGATGSDDQDARSRTPIALRWDGHGWASVAGSPIGGVFERVAPDGHGGMLASTKSVGDTIFHYNGRGWTPERVENDIWVTDIALFPGTTQSVAVGACCQGYDEDTHGRVWTRR